MGEIFNKSYADYSSNAEAEKAFSSFKHRWYERLVIAKELSANAFRLCYLLKPYFNLEYGGKAWPSQDTLAEQLGIERENVNKLLKSVVRHGHLTSQRGQHGCAYHMVLKEPAEEEVDQELRCVPNVTSDDKLETPDVTFRTSRCDASVTESSSTNFERRASFAGPGEREVAASAAPPGARPSLALGPPRRQRRKKKKDHHTAAGNGVAAGAVPHSQELATCRAMWQRGWSSDATPRSRKAEDEAWTAAIAKGATPETILAGAKKHIAAADAPRFLPKFSDWLNDDGWEKPPPKHKQANGSGRRSKGGGRRSRGDGAAVLDELHEKLAKRVRRKEAMQ